MESTVVHSDLLAEIQSFLDASKMAPTTFGALALNDPSFVRQIEEGRECRRATVAKVQDFMASYSEGINA